MARGRADSAGSPISVPEVARYPFPGMAIPFEITFSPDGRVVAFLRSPDRSLTQHLYALDMIGESFVNVIGH